MESIWHKAFEEHLGLFLFALFLSLVACFIGWYFGYFKSLKQKEAHPSLKLIHVLGAFFIYLGLALVVSLLIYTVLSSVTVEKKQLMSEQISAVKAWVSLITMSVIFVALIVYLKAIQKPVADIVLGKQGRGSFGLQLKNYGMGFVSLLISFPLVIATSQLANIVLVVIHQQSQEQLAVRFLKSAFQNPVAYIFSCFFVILIIPAIEELLFRGFLQNWLAKFLGPLGAIFSTSLIFAFFHFSMQQGWGNLEIIPSLFVLACFAGYIYFRQQSIFASFGLHSTYNALNVVLMTVAHGASI